MKKEKETSATGSTPAHVISAMINWKKGKTVTNRTICLFTLLCPWNYNNEQNAHVHSSNIFFLLSMLVALFCPRQLTNLLYIQFIFYFRQMSKYTRRTERQNIKSQFTMHIIQMKSLRKKTHEIFDLNALIAQWVPL